MNYPSFKFTFLNAPNLPFTKWCSKFEKDIGDNNTKLFLFGDNAIANTFFVKTIIQKRTFFNVFCEENIENNLDNLNKYIKNYCEAMLLKGYFSECVLKFDSGDDLVLRDYEQIDLKKNLKEEWLFYYKNKAEVFYNLSDSFGNMPFSYIWSMFFTETNTDALVLDEYVAANKAMFKDMVLHEKIDFSKKYKIIFVDGNAYRKDINRIANLVMDNGVAIIRNFDFDVPNMIGWRDLKNRIIGLIRV